MKIVILSAPPKAGKDELAKMFVENKTFLHREVKSLLFDAAIRTAGISRDLWFALYNDRDYKEIPAPYLRINGCDVSPRQFMIHVSEKVMKPIFGNDVFGKAAVENLKKVAKNSLIVYSDGGFIDEMIPMIEYLDTLQESGIPSEFHLVRVHRQLEDGSLLDWGNDSRRYVYLDEYLKTKVVKAGIFQYDIRNMPDQLETCFGDICKEVGV